LIPTGRFIPGGSLEIGLRTIDFGAVPGRGVLLVQRDVLAVCPLTGVATSGAVVCITKGRGFGEGRESDCRGVVGREV